MNEWCVYNKQLFILAQCFFHNHAQALLYKKGMKAKNRMEVSASAGRHS